MNPCTHALDEYNLCVYRCDASLKELLIVTPSENDDHICAGDNCVCIGGDENHDPCDYEDDRATFDMSDDEDALASAGWGTDEDYGCYNGED